MDRVDNRTGFFHTIDGETREIVVELPDRRLLAAYSQWSSARRLQAAADETRAMLMAVAAQLQALHPTGRASRSNARWRGGSLKVAFDLLDLIARTCEELGIPYAVGGSMASMMYGELRTTRDVDVIVSLRGVDVPRLLARFPLSEFYHTSARRWRRFEPVESSTSSTTNAA